jgi:hypothetical protein
MLCVVVGEGTFRLDLSRTTKNTTIKTSDNDSPAPVSGFTENKTTQTSSRPQIGNIQTTPVAFRLGIEEISPTIHRNR